jgi:hypothetical protein
LREVQALEVQQEIPATQEIQDPVGLVVLVEEAVLVGWQALVVPEAMI